VIPGTTPAAADDDGSADPRLAQALEADSPDDIRIAMIAARLLVPVVAVRGDGEADMAVPSLVDADGRRALPVFSCLATLRRWQPQARPVPMPGTRVVAAAVTEGYQGIVLDVAGPVAHTVAGRDLDTLAGAARTLAEHPGAQVVLLRNAD
jgi:hypothetical protein